MVQNPQGADDLDAPLTPKRIKQLLEGLTSEKASERLARYGPNSIPEREVKWYEVLRRQFTSSMALMIEAAAILAAALRDTKENVRRRSSRRSSVDVEAPSGAAAEGVV